MNNHRRTICRVLVPAVLMFLAGCAGYPQPNAPWNFGGSADRNPQSAYRLPFPDANGVEILPPAGGDTDSEPPETIDIPLTEDVPDGRGEQQTEGPSIGQPPADRLDLIVDAPGRKQVGSGATFHLTIRNTGETTQRDVVIQGDFDDALLFPGSDLRTVRQELGDIAPRDERRLALTLVSESTGEHCCRFSVSSEGSEAVWKSVCVDFTPRQLQVEVVGPAKRTIGSRAEFVVKIVNTTDATLENVTAAVTFDAALVPREATTGADQTPGRLDWTLGDLGPREGVQLQVEFACRVAAERACLKAAVQARNVPEEQIEACVAVADRQGVLDVQLSDAADPLAVDAETDYEITVTNRDANAARNLQVEAVVPANLRVLSVTIRNAGQLVNQPADVQQNRVLLPKIDSLAAGETLDVTLRVKAVRPGDGECRLSVKADNQPQPVEIREPTVINPRSE